MFLARLKKKAPQGSAVASGDLKKMYILFFFESFQMFVNCIVQTHDSKC